MRLGMLRLSRSAVHSEVRCYGGQWIQVRTLRVIMRPNVPLFITYSRKVSCAMNANIYFVDSERIRLAECAHAVHHFLIRLYTTERQENDSLSFNIISIVFSEEKRDSLLTGKLRRKSFLIPISLSVSEAVCKSSKTINFCGLHQDPMQRYLLSLWLYFYDYIRSW